MPRKMAAFARGDIIFLIVALAVFGVALYAGVRHDVMGNRTVGQQIKDSQQQILNATTMATEARRLVTPKLDASRSNGRKLDALLAHFGIPDPNDRPAASQPATQPAY